MDAEHEHRMRVVFSWAKRRAQFSGSPGKFMADFKGELEVLQLGAEAEILNTRRDLLDPVHLAAQIEALAAHRALQNWDTAAGLLPVR